jgi:proteasome lid subunit RPN8/RPN11
MDVTPMKNTIQISRKISNQLLHSAQQSPEFEICGLIGSKNGMAISCYPITNTAATPESRFLLDSKQQITAMSTMREKGEDLFAIYHSHPHAPAIPSTTDMELAAYPDVLHLIMSLNVKGILEMRAFKIAHNSYSEVMLTLTENTS